MQPKHTHLNIQTAPFENRNNYNAEERWCTHTHTLPNTLHRKRYASTTCSIKTALVHTREKFITLAVSVILFFNTQRVLFRTQQTKCRRSPCCKTETVLPHKRCLLKWRLFTWWGFCFSKWRRCGFGVGFLLRNCLLRLRWINEKSDWDGKSMHSK